MPNLGNPNVMHNVPPPMPEQVIESVFSSRSITAPRLRNDLALPGSPERCLERAVFEDRDGHLWVAESLHPSRAEHGERMARLTAALSEKGCAFVHPYRPIANGCFLNQANDNFWRVSAYLSGSELRRPEYIWNEAMGRNLGRCLGELRRASQGIGEKGMGEQDYPAPPFVLREYVSEIMDTVRRLNPGVYGRAVRTMEWAAPFLERADSRPLALCHGDFHPLNVIWRGEEVAGLIDWEFAGLKHELYDAAILVGCVGIELPDALGRGLVPAFLRQIREERILTPENERDLLPLVVCVRFAWLSEWLRKRDREMVELELDYMDVLTENADRIQAAWNLK